VLAQGCKNKYNFPREHSILMGETIMPGKKPEPKILTVEGSRVENGSLVLTVNGGDEIWLALDEVSFRELEENLLEFEEANFPDEED
jgi:hypothetical protein